MFLSQGIVGRHYLLSFHKARSCVPYVEGDVKGSIATTFQLNMPDSGIRPGHFSPERSYAKASVGLQPWPVLTLLLCIYPTDNAIEAIDEFAFLEGMFTMPFLKYK